jgi:hypothetical protein
MKNRGRVIIMTAFLLIGMALWYPALRSRRVAAQSMGLTGSYGFTASAPYTGANNSGPLAIVGVITFDGAGNLMGNETLVQPDTSPNATTVQTQTVRFAGQYTVNSDGTGTLTVIVPNGPTIPISFVITDGGSSLMFVETGSASGGNNLLTGTARKQ